MYEGVGNAVDAMFKFIMWSLVIAWPLAIWKLIEIIIWVVENVEVGLR